MSLGRRGKFITIEGIEGVGKSTIMADVRRWLEQAGVRAVLTREPGGTPLAEEIRRLVKDPEHPPCTPDTELLLIFAARSEHMAGLIRPALERGEWVVCDRFTDATYAYQGAGRGIDTAHIRALETWLQEGLRPDLTLLLDADVEVGMRRAKKRGSPDRFELEQRAFFQRVRQAYLDIAELEPGRVGVVDAGLDKAAVRAQVRRLMAERLGIADDE